MPDQNEDMAHPPIVPLMPSGNGVTDLEVAREQEAVAAAGAASLPEQPPMDDVAGGPQADDAASAMPGEQPIGTRPDPQVPTEDTLASRTSEAHPS